MAPKHTITPIALIKVTPFIAMKMMQYLFQDNQGDGQMMRKLLFMANCGNSDFPFSFSEKKRKMAMTLFFMTMLLYHEVGILPVKKKKVSA